MNFSDFEILKIYLNDFCGFSKTAIQTLVIEFVDNVQVITSRNGSGKTEFAKECSPLPMVKSMFGPKGGKSLLIRCGGKMYKVTHGHNKYSMQVQTDSGWDELNGGNTKAIYLQLMETHFGFNEYLWHVAVSGLKFTSLGNGDRRTWLEAISGQDMTYALSIHKRVTQSIADYRGAIRLDAEDINSMTGLVRTPDELAVLKRESVTAMESINKLLLVRGGAEHTVDAENTRLDLTIVNNEIKKLSKEHAKYTLDEVGYKDIDAVNDGAMMVARKMSELNTHAETINKNIALNNKLTAKEFDGLTIDTVEAMLKEMKLEHTPMVDVGHQDADRALLNITEGKSSGVIGSLVDACNSDVERLTPMLSTLDLDCLRGTYSVEDVRKAEETANTSKATIHSTRILLDTAKHRLVHHRASDSITCPSCDVNFKLNSDVDEASLTDDIKKYNKLIHDNTETLESLTVILEESNSVKVAVSDVVQAMDSSDYGLDGLYKLIARDSDTPTGIIHLLKAVATSLQATLRISLWETKHARLTDNLKVLRLVGDITEDIGEAEIRLSNIATELKELDCKLKRINLYKRNRGAYVDALERLAKLSELYKNQLEGNVEAESNGIIDKLVATLRIVQHAKSSEYNAAHIATGRYEEVVKKNAARKLKLERLVAIEKSLSPTTGIIAEQLVGFTDSFAREITSLVNRIWTSDMEVRGCAFEGKRGLNYQFPFLDVTDEHSVTSDISKGSTAEVAVMDLAIRIVSRMCLGMEHLPLHLDEVGPGFDTGHLEKLVGFIAELIKDHGASRYIIVHHDLTVRNNLPAHNTIVFDKRNVVLSKGYNAGVTITKRKV